MKKKKKKKKKKKEEELELEKRAVKGGPAHGRKVRGTPVGVNVTRLPRFVGPGAGGTSRKRS